MKILLSTAFFLIGVFTYSLGQGTGSTDETTSNSKKTAQKSISKVKARANNTVVFEGNLSDGQKIEDLKWAANSSVACFPATQNKKFTGNHVFFITEIPRKSEMFITVVPKNKKQNFSIYGYQVGLTNEVLPPKLNSCVTCEADHKWDYKRRGKTQDHRRSIRFNAINRSYKIVIGVVGAEGLTEGDFTLEIKLVGGDESSGTATNFTVSKLELSGTEAIKVKGNLSEGGKMNDLSWAAKSNVACFPATQNTKFRGYHCLYEVDLPKYSEMVITITPKDKSQNFSLYAYSVGTTSESVVPNLSRCVSCEADYKWDYKKRGKTQNHTRTVSLRAMNNPYKVYIGVAGAAGEYKGEFELKVEFIQ
jgi:hypothetical protein